MMPGLDWLTERPIAHRGLHDAEAGVIENSESAVHAAIAAGYAIEVDVQQTADGQAVVFHDFTLARLTDARGSVLERDLSTLETISLKHSNDKLISLHSLLEIVDGRVPLIIEMKSAEAGDPTLANVVAACAEGYRGPLAAMCFDPRLVDAIRKARPFMPRGLLSYDYRDDHAGFLPPAERFRRRHLVGIAACSPHFIAYDSRALPAVAPWLARRVLSMPLLAWTVRDSDEQARLTPHVDQIIFENFRPAVT